jgi:hypothetical protein
VRIAFGDVELAPDDVIARARIAADVDLLDIDAVLVDGEGQVHRPRLVLRSARGRTVANAKPIRAASTVMSSTLRSSASAL